MEIRTANREDYPQIKNLCEAQGWTSFRRPDFDAALDASIVLAAVEAGRFFGFARALTDGNITLFLCEIAVDASERQRGVGRRLIEELHARYPTCRIDLVSEADEFYAHCGFNKVGNGFRKIYI